MIGDIWRNVPKALGILAVGLAALILSGTHLSDRADTLSLGWWYSVYSASQESPAEAVVVAIDEDSYRELNVPMNQAWPRAFHVALLDRMRAFGAKRVVFDILFVGPGTNTEVDLELAKSMASIPTVIGADVVRSAPGDLYQKEERLEPYAPFAAAAEQVALVGFPEEYGVVSKFLVNERDSGRYRPSLAEAAAGFPDETTRRPNSRDLIRFYGGPGSIRRFSYYQVLDSEVPLPSKFFAGKTVFVGLVQQTGLGAEQKDSFLTPASRYRMYGTEIHATAATNMMEKRWIHRAESWVEFFGLVAFCCLVGACIILATPLWGGAVALVSLLAWALVAYGSFCLEQFIPGLLPVGLIIPITYVVNTLVHYLKVRGAQRRIKKAFEHYLAPEMVTELSHGSAAPKLGGEVIEGVALFSDIAGFTSICEKLSATEVTEMLNAYFTEVMEVVFQNRGTLIKFIGDATFVIWGAPIKVAEPATLALRTALAIQDRIRKFNASGRFPALHTRIGVHSGSMLVGNLGAKRRFDYTAIGDTINLASRIEGLNKYFGTNVLVTSEVQSDLTGTWPLLYFGKMRVVGKQQAVGLYAAFSENKLPGDLAFDLWHKAVAAFQKRDWNSARMLFGHVASGTIPLNAAAVFYQRQIDRLSCRTLDDSWSGEVDFDAK